MHQSIGSSQAQQKLRHHQDIVSVISLATTKDYHELRDRAVDRSYVPWIFSAYALISLLVIHGCEEVVVSGELAAADRVVERR